MTLFVSLKRFIFRIEMGLLVGSLLFMLWVLCYVIYVTRHNYAIEFDKITIPEEGECSFLIEKCKCFCAGDGVRLGMAGIGRSCLRGGGNV